MSYDVLMVTAIVPQVEISRQCSGPKSKCAHFCWCMLPNSPAVDASG